MSGHRTQICKARVKVSEPIAFANASSQRESS